MSAGGSGAEGDVDLNIAPIVYCFTVLIAYLLVSMSFISLGIFEAGVAATGPAIEQPDDTPPPIAPLSFAISLNADNSIELKLSGTEQNINDTFNYPAIGNAPDLQHLKTAIEDIKKSHPELKEANVSAAPTVRYKAIIKIIEAVKTQLPKVFLAS